MKPKRKLYEERLTSEIIGAAIEVHRELGPGLLESSYEICLARELELRGISFEFEKRLPLEYKGSKARLRISSRFVGLRRSHCGSQISRSLGPDPRSSTDNLSQVNRSKGRLTHEFQRGCSQRRPTTTGALTVLSALRTSVVIMLFFLHEDSGTRRKQVDGKR